MKTLVYKRTHIGDPDEKDWFGIRDCMGRVRGYKFDSVIGVGGKSSQPHSQGIATQLNWIGLGARKNAIRNRRAPVVTFEQQPTTGAYDWFAQRRITVTLVIR